VWNGDLGGVRVLRWATLDKSLFCVFS